MSTKLDPALELKCVNTIRAVSADQPQAANSGHPGAPMGCAPMAHVLWNDCISATPTNADWWNRDRFVLSNGHACALQYTMLHLMGYKITADDLKQFRKLGSITPGHPESFMTHGIEVCTGPLGQGISNAVGLAIAQAHLAATYNKDGYDLFTNSTYVLCGDGCLQEGVASEACSLAGHLGLGKLIVLYDDNQITIDGSTDLSFTEDVAKRFEAYGWQTLKVDDVTGSLDPLRAAIAEAQKETSKPTIIQCKTQIGYGSPSKQGSEKAHGAPLGEDDLKGAKEFYGLDGTKKFFVPQDVQDVYNGIQAKNLETYSAWTAVFEKYKEEFPALAEELERRFSHTLPEGIVGELPPFAAGKDKDLATRKFSQLCLEKVFPKMPELIGGSADLTPSNLTRSGDAVDFQAASPEGRYLRFGVREHGMAAVCNGLFAYGGMRPFCATFLVFTGYCLGAIRLSALSKFGVLYIMTHDSIGLGEDGPTHQPVETLESLRSIPNIRVYRPADAMETNAAYATALNSPKTPTVICCSRSTVKGLATSCVEKAQKGAYAVVETVGTPELILVATGSEVGICVEAAEEMSYNVRVVSMPCQELFLEQSIEYQKSVLPGDVPTLSVEAAGVHGWARFAHAHIAMTTFGRSGKGSDVMALFGYTKDNVVAKSKALLEFYKNGTKVPNLMARPFFDHAPNDGH